MPILRKTSPAGNKKQQQEFIPWKIRQVRPEDEEALTDIMQTSFSSMLPKDYDVDILDKALPTIGTPRPDLLTCPTWYVAEHPTTGEVVGCGGWTKEMPRPRSSSPSPAISIVEGFNDHSSNAESAARPLTPHLRHFATDPKWARRGVGRALWNRIWDEVCQTYCGPTSTAMEVFSTLTAEPFYSSLGFEPIKRMTIPLSNGCPFPCVLMRRTPKS